MRPLDPQSAQMCFSCSPAITSCLAESLVFSMEYYHIGTFAQQPIDIAKKYVFKKNDRMTIEL